MTSINLGIRRDLYHFYFQIYLNFSSNKLTIY